MKKIGDDMLALYVLAIVGMLVVVTIGVGFSNSRAHVLPAAHAVQGKPRPKAAQESAPQNHAGRISIGTNGQLYLGVGSGVSICPATGKLGIDAGGITIPMP